MNVYKRSFNVSGTDSTKSWMKKKNCWSETREKRRKKWKRSERSCQSTQNLWRNLSSGTRSETRSKKTFTFDRLKNYWKSGRGRITRWTWSSRVWRDRCTKTRKVCARILKRMWGSNKIFSMIDWYNCLNDFYKAIFNNSNCFKYKT